MKKGIAEVPGLKCGVGKGGIKKTARKVEKPDTLLIIFDKPSNFAAVFTQNEVKAAPVKVSQQIKGKIAGIIANSGNANACTGNKGIQDAISMIQLAQKYTRIKGQFLIASTGVIGEPLPMDRVEKGIKEAAENIGKAKETSPAEAIMTTDTFPKVAFEEGNGYVIGGIAKGAGMIDPSMATMLSFVATDAQISESLLKIALKEAVEVSFNAITVDGDMSTNDCVFLVATGKSNVQINENNFNKFKEKLTNLMKSLAYQIVKDGEGATKVARVKIKKAASREQAIRIARKIALSPLVKTALFGCDPNWGRIIAAAGAAQAGFIEEKAELKIGQYLLFKNGSKTAYNEKEVWKYMKNNEEIVIELHLNQGTEEFEYLTCDFSYDYIKINAEYRT
jgi:glutamate N-acetyltransferase/amino-acid N-acetyltransferase